MSRIIRKIQPIHKTAPDIKRVAAYARVSLEKETMLHSLSAQVSYYSDMIQKHSGWRYAGVYADAAMTGTKAERPEFQRLLADCRVGLIDMVLVKSISRFARNTVTLLETVRELKEINIDVFFEKENIHSISGDGELMLSIVASYVQAESHSVSENCKWRIRKSYEAGKPVTWRFLYGYRIQKGQITIHPEEAAIVNEVFSLYLHGVATADIAASLRKRQIPCYRGGIWTPKRVIQLLQNEKYAGNSILQKRYVVDHLQKKEKRNIGQLPIYFAEGTHPAIISPDTYQQARILMERNRLLNGIVCKPPQCGVFTGMITCSSCGQHYKRKSTHGKIAWNCTTFLMMGKKHCHAKQIPEDILISTTASVLGLHEFSEEVFKNMIRHIHVPAFNHLIYEFMDGTSIERVWQDKSRSEGWNGKMRLKASENAQKRWNR